MGRLLFVLLLLVAGTIALGLYLGWFDFSASREPGGQTDIKVRIDEKRIESDAEKAKEKVRGVFDGSRNKAEDK